MTNYEEIKKLEGMNLLGLMELKLNEVSCGDYDNAIALFVGKASKPECYVLYAQNADYSCYDDWQLKKLDHLISRDDRYKAIGEKIKSVLELKIDDWTREVDQYQVEIKTKTKVLRIGHHWFDCHYPNSIWDIN